MIETVAVLGAGTMGHSIANNLASHGIKVNLYESFDQVRCSVMQKIRGELQIMVDEGYFEKDIIRKTLNNITLYSELKPAVIEADFVIEALPEILKLKQDLLAQLDGFCRPDTILASNTSSLKLQDMGAKLSENRKKKFLIAHCYNPAHLIPIIELSDFGNMSAEDFEEVRSLFLRCEKAPVRVQKDVTGMVANRLLHAQAREAFYLIDQGIASAEDVDRALMFGPCFRNATTGMLECADMGGLDIWYAAEGNFFPDLAANTAPSQTMGQLVAEGNYGIKTGKGFFEYPQETRQQVMEDFNRRLIWQLKASRAYRKGMDETDPGSESVAGKGQTSASAGLAGQPAATTQNEYCAEEEGKQAPSPDDIRFMKEAIRQAKKAAALEEVPIGCVIVHEGKIIARGYNRRNTDHNTLAHAEVAAIRKASKKLGDWRLEGCTMYVTLEPCQMCAGALVQSRISKVVIGAMNAKAGCAGSVLNLLKVAKFNHQVEIEKGVCQKECSEMLSSFFSSLREKRKKDL